MLIDLKRIECIIFDEKFQFCVKQLKIVKYVCDVDKRHLLKTMSKRDRD